MSATVTDHAAWPVLHMDVAVTWRGPRGQAVAPGPVTSPGAAGGSPGVAVPSGGRSGATRVDLVA